MVRSGALEIWISPSYGAYICRIKKVAPDAASVETNRLAITVELRRNRGRPRYGRAPPARDRCDGDETDRQLGMSGVELGGGCDVVETRHHDVGDDDDVRTVGVHDAEDGLTTSDNGDHVELGDE